MEGGFGGGRPVRRWWVGETEEAAPSPRGRREMMGGSPGLGRGSSSENLEADDRGG